MVHDYSITNAFQSIFQVKFIVRHVIKERKSTKSMAPDFCTGMKKVIMADMRNCCSDEDPCTAPWGLILFIILFPFASFKKVNQS